MIIESFVKPYCQMTIIDSLIVVVIVFFILGIVGAIVSHFKS